MKAEDLINKHLILEGGSDLAITDGRIYNAFLNALNEAINYTRCCKSDSEQLVCVVDFLGNFTKGGKYLCKPDGLKYLEVEDDFGCLYKVHKKCFNKQK